ncbi:MAG: DTW domain-containing protein [Deltaproteobacteria bacterium]|nr:DTW domain-containing protein [Deltaproteobacteria bacterium]
MAAAPRALCLRCLRPASICYCVHLAPIASATHVVFLQHPRESRLAIGTCRMAHLGLAGSELHCGVSFEAHPRVRALAADSSGGVAVLYPGGDAREPEVLGDGTTRTLIVLDGTWHQVRAMWRANPSLHRLPRIGFTPASPGNYRIRREPAPHCLATVEAVVEALGRLEREPARFRPMLRAFDQMVETQLVYRTLKPGAPWRRRKRRRQPQVSAARVALRARRADLVVVYAEANAHPIGSEVAAAPELAHLVACRPATGERFAAIVAPRGALAPSTPHHLELSAARLRAGEDAAAALARWRAFTRPVDFLCSWGWHSSDLLRGAGDRARAVFDLRGAVTRELGRRTSGIEGAAAALRGEGALSVPWTEGRAGRRIAALSDVVERLAE